MNLLFFIALIALGYAYQNLSARLLKCERLLKELKNSTMPLKEAFEATPEPQQSDEPLTLPPPFPEIFEKEEIICAKDVLPEPSYEPLVQSPPPPPPEIFEKEEIIYTKNISSDSEIEVTPPPKAIQKKTKMTFDSFKIPNIIKENWMGVFGSIALVIGAVFFGLTSQIMQQPEARVSLMIAFSLLLFGGSFKLKNHEQWTLHCAWLKSIAGTVILFATIGAGGIEGLQFIQSPPFALGFLCIGIGVNILLASITPSQAAASLHVILSIIAFCLAPQNLILLPMGALVATIGLTNAYRAKWDVHLLLIVIAFSCQNFFWTFNLDLQPWMHGLAIGCSVVVGLAAGLIHYSKKYKSPKLELLPFIAHLTNWGLLALNIWRHAPFFKWTPLALGGIAIAGFVLARIARRKEIPWLYLTDTLLSQLMAVSAIICLMTFSVKPIDICLLILLEVILFSYVSQVQKENCLVRVGYCLQVITTFITGCFAINAITFSPAVDLFAIYLRMGMVTAVSWGYYFHNALKKLDLDDYRFIFLNEREIKNPLSLSAIFGCIFFLGIYLSGFHSLIIQSVTFLTIATIGFWRAFKEDFSTNLVMVMTLIFVHILNWGQLVALSFEQTAAPSIVSNVNFLGLLLLDLVLLARNLLEFKLWKKNLLPILVYFLGMQVGLLTYVFTKDIGVIIPGLTFVGFSLLSLEAGRYLPNFLRCCPETQQKAGNSIVQVGYAFLLSFVIQFIPVHHQMGSAWHGISLNWVTEIFGLFAILYWLAFYPKNLSYSLLTRSLLDRLVELCLGFILFCAVLEMSNIWSPLNLLDISLLILLETIVFSYVYQVKKDNFLIRVGYGAQLIATCIAWCFAINAIIASPTIDHFAIYLRMGIATMVSWGYYLFNTLENFHLDDYRFIFRNDSKDKNPISISAILGSVFFLTIYFYGFDSLIIQSATFLIIVGMGIWKKFKDDISTNLAIVTALIFIHLLNWNQLVSLLFEQTSALSILSNFNFLGMIILDVVLIAGNFLEFRLWKKNLHSLLVYALGVQVGLLTYVFTKDISLLIPGLVFLGFSLFALEFGSFFPKFLKCSPEAQQEVGESIIQVGLAFLIGFASRFITVNLQTDPIWHGISLRWIIEAFGLSTILYWLIFYPKNIGYSAFTQSVLNRLVELCLGFITLCAVVEIPEIWRPLLWAIMAISLLLGNLDYHWPKRLYGYSWIYFSASIIHMAFVTSTLTMPSLFLIERYHFLTFMAMALQFYYAYLVHRKQGEIDNGIKSIPFISKIYEQSSLTILLPVFLGVALLFAFNFEKAILTLLWVGLTCAYLSVGLLIKSKRSIQIGMSALAFCSARLIIFDLVQSDLALRALVFIGVGGLMLGISALYKKYKYRIESHEKV